MTVYNTDNIYTNIDYDICNMKNDIHNIENNIECIDVLFIIINNNKIEKCIKKKKQITNNFLSKDEIINIIKKVKSLDKDEDKYTISYLLKFSIDNDYETISCSAETDNAMLNINLTSIVNIEDIHITNNFTSLIIVLKEKEKIYYVSKKYKKNKTKKRF